jgi:hypothetical protein
MFTVRMSCSQYRWRNCFVKRMVKISISRKDLLGYSSSITKCRWSLGWSWGIPLVKLTGWAGHSYSLFFLAGLIWEYMYVCMIYIYMLYVHIHVQYVLASQNIHVLGWVCKIGLVGIKHLFLWSYHGKRFFVYNWCFRFVPSLLWMHRGWVSFGVLTGSCWTFGFMGHLMTHPKSIEKWQSNPTNPWI